MAETLRTPDGRYLIVRGRLWRTSNPQLGAAERQTLVNALMTGRRAKRDALHAGDHAAVEQAKRQVDAAKRGLGERGPVWWTDGTPDENRKLAKNSSYAAWYATVTGSDIE